MSFRFYSYKVLIYAGWGWVKCIIIIIIFIRCIFEYNHSPYQRTITTIIPVYMRSKGYIYMLQRSHNSRICEMKHMIIQ